MMAVSYLSKVRQNRKAALAAIGARTILLSNTARELKA